MIALQARHLLHGFILLVSLFSITAWADDPPSQVARLNAVEGTVTFAPAGSTAWAYAPINRPMTSGDQLWVDQTGRAELHVGSTALRLGAQTSLMFLALDDQNTQLKLTQGTLNLRVRTLFNGQHLEIDTPNLALVVNSPGAYRLDVDPARNTTRVTVWQGSGSVLGNANNTFSLHDGDQITWFGADLTEQAAMVNPYMDEFDRWAQARDQREDNSVSAQYVSRETTGYETLDDNGIWQADPQYGAVWVPSVTVVGWAPYRYGHWVWIAPWGWTWVDDAPWGFAPFHYGRWAYLRSRWCWVPGPVYPRPVYAPALVAFAGGAALRLSVSNGPGVAWFALGPGEAYRPAYGSSQAYISRINRTTMISNANHNMYVNQHVPNAITAMNAGAFVRGQRTQGAMAVVSAQQLGQAQFQSAPRFAPVSQSLTGAERPAPATSGNVFNRAVISTRTPPQPFAAHDDLAGRFTAHGQNVPGVGTPLTRPAVAQPQVNVIRAPQPAAPIQNRPVQSQQDRSPPHPQQFAPRSDTGNGVPPHPPGAAPRQNAQDSRYQRSQDAPRPENVRATNRQPVVQRDAATQRQPDAMPVNRSNGAPLRGDPHSQTQGESRQQHYRDNRPYNEGERQSRSQ